MAELFDLLRTNYLSVLINVSSFAFQIAGAVLLLLWSIRKIDTKIKEQCLESAGILSFQFDESGIYTDIPKDDLQSVAKITYKNIAAFINILIGYTCAIFSAETPLPRWSIFVLVIVLTAIILWIENIYISHIAKKRYPENERIYDKERTEKDVWEIHKLYAWVPDYYGLIVVLKPFQAGYHDDGWCHMED